MFLKIFRMYIVIVFSLLLVFSLVSCSNKIVVSFNSNGGSDIESQIFEEASLINEPINPTREGYTFDGWYKNETNIKWNFLSSIVDKSIVLTAHWIRNQYTLTIDYGKLGIVKKTYYYDEYVIVDGIEKNGFTCYLEDMPTKMPSTNVTIKARWIPKTADDSYLSNGEQTEKGMKFLYFGSCPQFIVNDSNIIKKLNSFSVGAGGIVELDGKRYLKVSPASCKFERKLSNKEVVQSGSTYWIKYDKIKFNIESDLPHYYYLRSFYSLNYMECDLGYASGKIKASDVGIKDFEKITLVDDYYYSNIRYWLNKEFIKFFSIDELESIIGGFDIISKGYTGYTEYGYYPYPRPDKYVRVKVEDYFTLPSDLKFHVNPTDYSLLAGSYAVNREYSVKYFWFGSDGFGTRNYGYTNIGFSAGICPCLRLKK